MNIKYIFILPLFLLLFNHCDKNNPIKTDNVRADQRYRVIVSSDIGGTDYDDFQSMVHLFLYADTLYIEGLISSPFGDGRKEDILQVIDYYEQDYIKLKQYSDKYPDPNELRAITKQGAIASPGPVGISTSTEGSDWIVQCARRDDPLPLHILVWGGIEDLAQALYDAPDILPKLRVYFIGGPNKKWSVNAYHYIATNHLNLWIIESNATYRGWFTGGDQSGEWGNSTFVSNKIAVHGALGNFFLSQGSSLKMGDSPSVARLLRGKHDDPSQPSWGGQFLRAWERPHIVFNRMTSFRDSIEHFGVFDLVLSIGAAAPAQPMASLAIDNQLLTGLVNTDGTVRFLFSPKDAIIYSYTIHSNAPVLSEKTGRVTAFRPPEENKQRSSPNLPNWWTDDPSSDASEGQYIGAKTVSRWRIEFLSDFATRLDRVL